MTIKGSPAGQAHSVSSMIAVTAAKRTRKRALRPLRALDREQGQMNSNTPLFIIIIGLLGLTGYLIATRPVISDDERRSMEDDWWG
jgi:hypothetical protein